MSADAASLRIALGIDEQWYVPFFVDLAERLAGTGAVQPTLLLTRGDCPDPLSAYPVIRLDEPPENPRTPAWRSVPLTVPAIELDWEDLTGFEVTLADLDAYYAEHQVEAARQLAARAADRFRQARPDCLIVWGGTRLGPRTLARVARSLGIAVVTLETPYFQHLPGMPENAPAHVLHRMSNRALIWDTLQAPQCGPSMLTRDWPHAAPHPELPAFLEQLIAQRRSKFAPLDVARFLAGRKGESMTAADLPAAEGLPDAGSQTLFPRPPGFRALLVCGQVDRDSSIFHGQGLVRSWRQLALAAADALPAGWVMGFKGHPLDRGYLQDHDAFADELSSRNPFCRVLPLDVEIHAALGACDALLCINSTAGIEALMHGKPVITLGRASYTHAGITHDVERPAALRPLLQSLPAQLTARQLELRDRFLSYVLYTYLIPCGEPPRMLARIRQAMQEQATQPAMQPPPGRAAAPCLESTG